jgi:hypothetical protein
MAIVQSSKRIIRGRRLLTLWVCFVLCGRVQISVDSRLGIPPGVEKGLYALLVLLGAGLAVLSYRADLREDLPRTPPNYMRLSIPPAIFRIGFVLIALCLPTAVWRDRLTSPLSIIGLSMNLMWLWIFYHADLSHTALKRQRSIQQSSSA